MRLALTVNGSPVAAEVEPRTSLADFLRESQLLTGTHLGCEHGICGACTVLLDGEPVRSCIAYAVDCEGRDVRSIEGLDDDPVAIALRAAFRAEHALQCGYCTPGMLVTARDIVLRLPEADNERIRLELAGNLCRCTGYVGIVKAIRRVLTTRPEISPPERAVLPARRFAAAIAELATAVAPAAPQSMAPGDRLTQRLRLNLARDVVWRAVQDPELVAGCVPGARILSQEGGRIRGEILASLGPIRARFSGEAVLTYEAAAHAGSLVGEGRDAATGTRLTGEATFRVTEEGPTASVIELSIAYALRGPLAQFGRGPIVQVFARELAETTARNLEARLRGETTVAPAERLTLGGLMIQAMWRWARGLFSRRAP
jgi:carbon-monoxide dehydrogenase small subunit